MANDVLGNLREYLSQLHQGEKSSSELSADFGLWLKEGGESIKEKVESEIESAALRMGFVQVEELDSARSRIKALERELSILKARLDKIEQMEIASPINIRKVPSRIKKVVKK